MKIDAEAGKQGEFEVTAHTFYADPYAVIRAGALVLGDISEDDANRMIAALCEAKNKIAALREQYAQPHKPPFTARRCLNCGKPMDDEVHADPAPVITDSDRTCDQANPASGAWCHRDGDHGVHRDTDGEEWRADGAGGVMFGPMADDEATAVAS